MPEWSNGMDSNPLAYAYLGSNPSTCIMNLISKINIRIKANNNFKEKLESTNRSEIDLFRESEKIKKRFERYITKDEELIEMVRENNSATENVLKKTLELLESQTYLIQEYAIYKKKYRIIQN